MYYPKLKFGILTSDEQLNKYCNIKIEFKNGYFSGDNPEDGGFSFYLNDSYICLDMDINSCCICNISGDYSIENMTAGYISIPEKYTDTVLKVELEENMLPGCAWRISMEQFNIIYDKMNSAIQIGKLEFNRKTYRIFNNVFVQLDSENYMACIIITRI